MSPDPRINPSMNGTSGSCSSSGGGGVKQHHPKTSRGSSHHGGSGKKKSSPVPGSSSSHGGGGSNAGKELFVLVAAEAMPLSSAGIVASLITQGLIHIAGSSGGGIKIYFSVFT